MQLTVWTYEGPPHVGAMRVATAMEGVHYVLHAPQGDTYADLLFTMIERRGKRPPVTYTTFQARDLGTDTAELFQSAARDAYERFKPQAMIVGASCTAELIQDDPAGLALAMNLPIPVIALDLPSYSRKECWGAAETFYQLVRTLADPAVRPGPREGRRVRANLLGPTALGFRHRDDVIEVTKLLASVGVDVHVVAPLGASPADLKTLGAADFNVLMYPETGDPAARWLDKTFGQKFTKTVPIGIGATNEFLAEVRGLASLAPLPEREGLGVGLMQTDAVCEGGSSGGARNPAAGASASPTPGPSRSGRGEGNAASAEDSRFPWWSRSVDSTYLTGKRVFIFGDATHAVAAARVASAELGFEVVGLGCYNREFARDIREAAKLYGVEPLITDDYLAVEEAIAASNCELVLGTQMERHIAKRLRIPCAVISAPVHVQDFPARHSPQMGFEGANVIFDTWVHPLTMGLEEHLLTMFRDDFEFNDGAGASHLGHGVASPLPEREGLGMGLMQVAAAGPLPAEGSAGASPIPDPSRSKRGAEDVAVLVQPAGWTAEAERELMKIPFFVRGKARRNTEAFAAARALPAITLDTLYDAKAHHAR